MKRQTTTKRLVEHLKTIPDVGKVVFKQDIITITVTKDFLVSIDAVGHVLYINGIYNCNISVEYMWDYINEIIHGCYEFVLSTKPNFARRFIVKTKPKGYYDKHEKRLNKKAHIKIFNEKQVLLENE
jgi:hypothetical protein